MSTLTIGSIDLNDRTKYQWRQLPQKKNYSLRVRDWRGRDSSRLTYRKLTSISLEFEVICLGATMTVARANEALIESTLDSAAEWSINRTNADYVGSEILYTEAAGGESPRIYSVQYGLWEEHDQALWALENPQIQGHLSLTLVPYFNGVKPYPVRLVLSIPAIHVAGAPVTLTPSPVTIPLVVPAPSVTSPVILTPSPVTIPLVVPAPVIDNSAPRVMLPDPVQITLVLPAPVLDNGAPDLFVTPDPVAIPLVIPAPTIDDGASLVTTNLLVDYDVEALGLSDGTDITTWTDESGNGKDLTGVTSHKPVSQSSGGPNGKKYATFNGSQVAKSSATDCMPTGTAERIIFVVFECNNRTPAAANIACYGQIGSSGAHYSVGLQGGNDNIIGYFWSSNTSQHSVGDISTWHAVALQLKADGHPRWWVDGADVGSDAGLSPSTGSGIFAIGGRDGDDGDFTGKVARVLGHGALTDGQIASQFAYIRSTYGTP